MTPYRYITVLFVKFDNSFSNFNPSQKLSETLPIPFSKVFSHVLEILSLTTVLEGLKKGPKWLIFEEKKNFIEIVKKDDRWGKEIQ